MAVGTCSGGAVGACSAPGVGVALIAATHVNTMVSMVTGTIVVTGQGEGSHGLARKVVKAEDGV